MIIQTKISFGFLGVLDSLERDECKQLIVKYGGRVTTAISGKTNFLITGRDSSEAKQIRANELKIRILSEDDLLEMIRTRSGDDENEKKEEVVVKPRPKKEKAEKVKKTTTDHDSTLLCKFSFDK